MMNTLRLRGWPWKGAWASRRIEGGSGAEGWRRSSCRYAGNASKPELREEVVKDVRTAYEREQEPVTVQGSGEAKNAHQAGDRYDDKRYHGL